MKLNTTRFGVIDVQESSFFEFISPILGYEDEKKFMLIEHSDSSKFKWLQSVQTPSLAFVVTVAGLFGIDYSFELSDVAQEELAIEEAEDILALSIVVIPHSNPRGATINLLAPIIVNLKTNKASQIILTGSDFEVNYPLFEKEVSC